MKQDLRGTWTQALVSLFIPVLIVLTIRWLVVEPFIIPSTSMVPNLLINDHILVKKSSYGFRFPFSKSLYMWSKPQFGDIVVFRYPKDPNVYFVKRLIGLPGDTVQIKNGRLFVNEKPVDLNDLSEANINQLAALSSPIEEGFQYFEEGSQHHIIRKYKSDESSNFGTFLVPPNSYFMMGDNRDQSSDSRVWGVVSEDLIVGKVWAIWMSCDEMLMNAQFLCDPQTIRWTRLFKSVK